MKNLTTRKRDILKKQLAGIANPESVRLQGLKQKKMEEQWMKNTTIYRGRPRQQEELIKPKGSIQRKKIRKEEELLGITALV